MEIGGVTLKRKIIKLILFIFGAVVTAFCTVLFIMNILHLTLGTKVFWHISQFGMGIILMIGLVPMSIAMLMHAKDIKDKKKGFAVFLTILSIFWLAGSALNATIIVITSLVFG